MQNTYKLKNNAMPRTRLLLNAKTHQLGWLKTKNFKTTHVSQKLRPRVTRVIIQILQVTYYNNHLPIPFGKKQIF